MDNHGTSRRFILEPKITLGNLLEIVTLVFLVGTGYAQLNSQQIHLKELIQAQQTEVENLKKSYVRSDVQELRDARLNEKLDEVYKSLERIEKLVK